MASDFDYYKVPTEQYYLYQYLLSAVEGFLADRSTEEPQGYERMMKERAEALRKPFKTRGCWDKYEPFDPWEKLVEPVDTSEETV